MKLPKFEAAYRKARHDAFCKTIARLQHASSSAVSRCLFNRRVEEQGRPVAV